MGFFKDLRKRNKKLHKDVLKALKLNNRAGKTASKVARNQFIPPGAEDAREVAKKTIKNSDSKDEVLGNMVRYSARRARDKGKTMGAMGNYMIVLGMATGQPHLIALGTSLENAEDAFLIAAAPGDDFATFLDASQKGDFEEAVVALGRAMKDFGVAIANQLSEGVLGQAIEVAEDILAGDYDAAKKQAAAGLLSAVASKLHASHIKGHLLSVIKAGTVALDDETGYETTFLGLEEKNSSSAMRGGQAAEQAAMSEPTGVISASTVPSLDDLPGGAARAEETITAGDPSPDQEAVTQARATLEKKVAVNQNLDDEMTMCGEGHVPHLKGTYYGTMDEEQVILDRTHGSMRVHGMAGPYKIREHKRSYSAVGVTPSQYQNAGISVANRMDIPVKVARVTSMVHENPIKTKLKGRPTVRGFSANYTTKPRQSVQQGDARGDLVKYVDALKALKGTVQKDETDVAVDKSMAGFLETVPEESLVIDSKGPMKSATRSRMVTRSMKKHEKEMGSLLKVKGF